MALDGTFSVERGESGAGGSFLGDFRSKPKTLGQPQLFIDMYFIERVYGTAPFINSLVLVTTIDK